MKKLNQKDDQGITKKIERGQVLVLMALAMIVLLGFTSLAIDGGMIYADRRAAQNTADAAAFSGILEKARGNSDAVAIQSAFDNASINGYDSSLVDVSVWTQVDITGNYHYVSAEVTSTTKTAFLHFVYAGDAQNKVIAITKVRETGPPMPGVAIVAMDDCTTGSSALLRIDGGGVDAGIQTFNGGMFINSPEPSGYGHCAIDSSDSTGSKGINAHGGHQIHSVGFHSYAGEEKISPEPIQTGFNNGQPISDPLENLPEPVCTSNGSRTGNNFQPGRFGGPGEPSLVPNPPNWNVNLAPGIYCITGDVSVAGQFSWTGDGVVLYFIDGALSFQGTASLTLTAPTDDNCLGETGDPTASCTYKGVAIYSSRSNTSAMDMRGNGRTKVTGLVYALNGTVECMGGGVPSDPDEWIVNGQIITGAVVAHGTCDFWVNYDADNTHHLNAMMNLER